MIYRIALICDEIEDFFREITIDSEATFLDLSRAILDSCGYPDDQLTSFYLCDESWVQKTQVTREDMGVGASDEDIYVMGDTRLNELIEDEGQHLVYVFDPFNDRVFYMDVKEILPGGSPKPQCTVSIGKAPVQIKAEEATSAAGGKSAGKDDDVLSGEEFYGSEGFNEEEFDNEGFGIDDDNAF